MTATFAARAIAKSQVMVDGVRLAAGGPVTILPLPRGINRNQDNIPRSLGESAIVAARPASIPRSLGEPRIMADFPASILRSLGEPRIMADPFSAGDPHPHRP